MRSRGRVTIIGECPEGHDRRLFLYSCNDLYCHYIVDVILRPDGTHLSVNFDHGFAMAGIYLVSAVRAQSDPGNIICKLITVIVLTRQAMLPPYIRRDRIGSIGCISLTENLNLLHLDTTRRNALDKNGRSSRAPVPRAYDGFTSKFFVGTAGCALAQKRKIPDFGWIP